MFTPRVRWVALTAALALAAAGCGSTVNNARRDAGRVSDDRREGSALADEFGGEFGDDTGATSDTRSTRSGGAANRTTATVGRGSASSGSSGVDGPGVTATSISIGVGYAVNSSTANAAIGVTGVTTGDDRGQQQALIDDINAKGGVAGGRKIVPIWHEYDNTSTDSADVAYQKACDDYTQDHKSFVVLDRGRDIFNECVQSRGSFNLADGGITDTASSTYKRFPYYLELSSLNLDRSSAVQPGLLKEMGYFSGWDANLGAPAQTKAKVGIITYDYPTFRHAVDEVMVPALKAAGYAPDARDIRRVTWLQSNSDTGALAAAVSSAVLRFRQDGVTHVIILDERAVITLLFIREADSQRYRPRYGLNSQNGVQVLVDGGNLNARQLEGALGIGWSPTLDITPSQNRDDGPYSNDARRRCIAFMASKGFTFPDANAAGVALGNCNTIWFFRDVVNSIRGPINRDTFIAAVNGLGTRFESAGTFLTRFAATQHDGVAAVRKWRWDSACSCGKYTSGNIVVP